MASSRMRRDRARGLVCTVAVLAAGVACTIEEVFTVEVTAVIVEPAQEVLGEGDTLVFTVRVTGEDGALLQGAHVRWSSEDQSVLAVDDRGRAQALRPGTTTVRATYQGAEGTAEVTVMPGHRISVSAAAVRLLSGKGGPPSAPASVQITNGGGGTLGGLSAEVAYPAAGPTGWLRAALSSTTAPAVLDLTGDPRGLASGSHAATVVLSAPGAWSGPVELAVTLSVTGITVAKPAGGVAVQEGGSTDGLAVALDTRPEGDVVVALTSSDPSEAAVEPRSLRFTSLDWDVPRSATVTAADDDMVGGDRTVRIVLSINDALSDPTYRPALDRRVTVKVFEDDVAGFTITESGGETSVAGAGRTDSFTAVLTARPMSSVELRIRSGDRKAVRVDPESMTFTSADWNVPQTVTVTDARKRKDDDDDDDDGKGSPTTTVTISVHDSSSDDAFDDVPDKTVIVTTNR